MTATLLSAAPGLVPGGASWLGLRYDIAPGWHIYWKNPGDSGMATSVAISAPGLQAGPIAWPGPRLLPAAGGLRVYGYEGSVTLLIPVELAAELAPGAAGGGPDPLPIHARTRWLACREDSCVPGQAELELRLPLLAELPAEDGLATARKVLPRALPPELSPQPGAEALVLLLPGAAHATVFPELPMEAALQSVELSPQGDALRVALSWKAGPPVGAAAVLQVDRPDGSTAYTLVVPPLP